MVGQASSLSVGAHGCAPFVEDRQDAAPTKMPVATKSCFFSRLLLRTPIIADIKILRKVALPRRSEGSFDGHYYVLSRLFHVPTAFQQTSQVHLGCRSHFGFGTSLRNHHRKTRAVRTSLSCGNRLLRRCGSYWRGGGRCRRKGRRRLKIITGPVSCRSCCVTRGRTPRTRLRWSCRGFGSVRRIWTHRAKIGLILLFGVLHAAFGSLSRCVSIRRFRFHIVPAIIKFRRFRNAVREILSQEIRLRE